MEADSTHRLLRRPDFFFFLFFGRGDGELLDFLFTLELATDRENERGSGIGSEKGRKNSQVIVMIIIFRKNTFLIIVICRCADNKAIRVYFLISFKTGTGNHFEEITLNLFCEVTHAESAI